MAAEKHIVEPERRTPVFREMDVCVVGGSPSEVAAAVCAARNGAQMLLVERDPYLSGQSVGTMAVQWERLRESIHFSTLPVGAVGDELG